MYKYSGRDDIKYTIIGNKEPSIQVIFRGCTVPRYQRQLDDTVTELIRVVNENRKLKRMLKEKNSKHL